MKVRLLIDLQGAVNGRKGEVKDVDNETGQMLVSFMLVELYQRTPRPKRKPIIVHTRSSKCIKEQK